MVPVDPFEPISTTSPGKADKNYLFDAASLAYVNSFQLLNVISLACMPFVFLLRNLAIKNRGTAMH
jgi:hypothetical protein